MMTRMPRCSGVMWLKVSCKKATAHVNRIGNCTGENEICDMWKDHFKTLYNSVPVYGARAAFEHKCLTVQDDNPRYTVSVYDIIEVVSKQSKGKSAGPNGIFMESFIYACLELFVSLFFSLCVTRSWPVGLPGVRFLTRQSGFLMICPVKNMMLNRTISCPVFGRP